MPVGSGISILTSYPHFYPYQHPLFCLGAMHCNNVLLGMCCHCIVDVIISCHLYQLLSVVHTFQEGVPIAQSVQARPVVLTSFMSINIIQSSIAKVQRLQHVARSLLAHEVREEEWPLLALMAQWLKLSNRVWVLSLSNWRLLCLSHTSPHPVELELTNLSRIHTGS